MAIDKFATAGQVDTTRLPRHIAIIMDGNGRWATNRGLPRTAGHKAGSQTFETIATHCRDLGLDYLTVYAFSTENWKRSEGEVSAIMGLLKRYLNKAIDTMEKENIRLRFLGDLTPISPELKALIAKAHAMSDKRTGFQANVCLNYGGRDELVRASRAFAQDCVAGKRNPAELSEAVLSSYLDTATMPDPELVIRPSGELRLSNFLPWQSAYAEFYFSDILWPDFTPEHLEQAIVAYQQRDRRFGGVK